VKKFFIVLSSLITLIFLIQSCQKIDATSLGGRLIPVVDNVNTFDTTLEVITDLHLLPDSTSIPFATQNTIYNFSPALGVMEDPEFGRTSANMYFEMLPANQGIYPFSHRDSIQGRIDSVVLSLTYKGVYGDSMSVENFTVHEIAQSADFTDTLYKINGPDIPVALPLSQPVTVNFNTLNEPKIVKQGKDSAKAVPNVLRIPLNNALGLRLMNYDTTNAYKTDSSFRTYFKGLAIKTDTNTSAIKRALAYFDLTAATTRLYVYYRANAGASLDTVVTEFAFTQRSSTRSANIIRRNITGSNYAANLSNPDKLQELLYIQSSPGSYASVYIPGLKTLSNRVIHKAELIIPKVASQEENVFTPPMLFLDLIDSVRATNKTIPNDFMGDLSNGTYNTGSFGGPIKNDEYRFDLSRYIQGIATRKDTAYSLRLYAPFYTLSNYSIPNAKPPVFAPLTIPFFVNSQVAGGRVILAGGNHSGNRMRIRIIYSKI
jgi:hypothetical protein